jgi:pyrimidine-nucleoside phosphorylase
MRAVDLIRIKRDGGILDRDALQAFVSGVTDGSWPDYQASALLMAILLRGMTPEETADLTDAMVRSGVQVTYPDLPATPVDKHSTGGVGDKASIVLAPLAAACGAPVPMMSGRGLGHTGGTLDKLESIPGFRTALSLDELRQAVTTIGCALIGQTSDIAPADKRLYALRDVTSTVESIPLISASIMSKKIAEGIGGLVLDVKAGDGAFMKTPADARRLAESLVSIGEAAGVRTEALLTSMDAPLGRAVGNAVEIIECVETLKGNGPADVEALSVDLATRMLIVSGVESDPACAEGRIRHAIRDGSGLEKLKQIVENQGGDPRAIDDPSRMPSTPDRDFVTAPRDGFVAAMRAEAVGRAGVLLGAGRDRLDAGIDPAVGLMVLAPVGTAVKTGEPIIEIRHRGGRGLEEARRLLRGCLEVAEQMPPPSRLILDRVQGRTARS